MKTGFDDYLTLPKIVVETLQLPLLGQDEVTLANGEQYTVDICRGFAHILDLPELKLEVDIIVGDDEEALIGTRFLHTLCKKFSIDFEASILSLEGLKN